MRSASLLASLLLLPTSAMCQSKALVIGVGKYPHYPTGRNLEFASADAVAFARLLDQRAGVTNVISLIDAEATRVSILTRLDELTRSRIKLERLFVFFSGHAERHKTTDKLYLMPSDGNPESLYATGILASDFIEQLKDIGAKHTFLFMDACHTGAALRAKGTTGLDDRINSLNQALEGSYTAFLSSAADEVSIEDPESQLGLFTSVTVRGLSGEADGAIGNGRDGSVTVGELAAYVSKELPTRARKLSGRAQTPVIMEQRHSDFVLTTTAAPSESSKPTSRPLSSFADFYNISSVDPELGLLLHIEAASRGQTPSEMTRSEFVGRLLGTLDRSGWKKIGQVGPAPLIGGTISSDGSIYAGCSDASQLVIHQFQREGVRTLTFPLLGPTSPVREGWVLDACRISISENNQLVSVSASDAHGVNWVELFHLARQDRGSRRVEGARSAAFVKGLLVSVARDVLHVAEPESNTTLFSVVFPNLVGVLTEPEGHLLELSFSDGKNQVYQLDLEKRELRGRTALSGNQPVRHSLSKNWFSAAQRGRSGIIVQQDGSIHDLGCSDCLPLPSGVPGESGSWLSLMLSRTDPHAIYFFGTDTVWRREVRSPEPVATARMLSSGSVVVVGRRGGVYRMHSESFVDCCLVSELKGDLIDLSVADDGVIAALIRRVDGLVLNIFAEAISFEYRLPETFSAKQVMSVSAESALVSGDRSTLYVRFGSDKGPLVTELDCGYPLSLGPNKSDVACVVHSGRVGIFNLIDQRLRREFIGHPSPVHDIYLGLNELTVAGSFSGRPQSNTTTWRVATGALLFSRACANSDQATGARSHLLDRGFTLVVESGQRRTWHNAATCEVTWERPTAGSDTGGFGPASRSTEGVTWRTMGIITVDGPPSQVTYVERPRISRIVRAAISPLGRKVVAATPRHLLHVPVVDAEILAVAKASATRSLTAAECAQYFPQLKCPSVN